jgi:hypothetical protein
LHVLRSHLRAFERLEPGAVKVARPVLRGEGGREATLLPDTPSVQHQQSNQPSE